MKQIPKLITGVPVRIGTVSLLSLEDQQLSFDAGYKTAHIPYISGIKHKRLSDLIHHYLVEQIQNGAMDLSSHGRAFFSWVKWMQFHNIDPFVASPIPRFHPTYGFRHHLIERTKSDSAKIQLATSTASTYINHIKNFYQHLGRINELDASEFFQHERSIVDGNILVETSDLSISRISTHTKSLNPLSREEVMAFHKTLSLQAVDFQLMCRLMMYSGLRIKEVLSLPRSLFEEELLAVSEGPLIRGLLIGKRINGVQTKFGKQRELFISRKLYEDVIDFVLDDTVSSRLSKWRAIHGDGNKHEPLFINRNGHNYKTEAFYSRWYRCTRQIRQSNSLRFIHKPHDCRATFGTSFLQAATRSEVSITQALGALKVWMGHSQVSTTLKYIKYLERNEISNLVADVMDNFVLEASLMNGVTSYDT
jgi:integrase